MKEKRFSAYTYRILWAVIIISILGLIISPMLPWINVSYKRVSIDDPEGTEVNNRRSDIYIEFGHYNSSTEQKLSAIENDIDIINLGLWLSLIFGMIGLIGTVLFRTGKHEKLSLTLMLLAIGILVFSLITIGYHLPLRGDVSDLNAQYGDDITVSRSFNYGPLAAGISVLVCSLIYMIVLIPFAYSCLSDDTDGRQGEVQPHADTKVVHHARRNEDSGHLHEALNQYMDGGYIDDAERVARKLAKDYISQEEYEEAILVYEDADMWEEADNIRNLAEKERDNF